jgi:hypothetical protein
MVDLPYPMLVSRMALLSEALDDAFADYRDGDEKIHPGIVAERPKTPLHIWRVYICPTGSEGEEEYVGIDGDFSHLRRRCSSLFPSFL